MSKISSEQLVELFARWQLQEYDEHASSLCEKIHVLEKEAMEAYLVNIGMKRIHRVIFFSSRRIRLIHRCRCFHVGSRLS